MRPWIERGGSIRKYSVPKMNCQAWLTDYLRLIGQAWLIVTLYILLILFLHGFSQSLLGLLSSFNRLVLCLLEKPRHMITLTNPGLSAWLPKEVGSITKHYAIYRIHPYLLQVLLLTCRPGFFGLPMRLVQ
jgi:hypothetical protein